MKKITILLVIIFTFLFTNTSWGEWNLIPMGVGEDWYYNKDNVRKRGKSLYVWFLHDFSKPTESGYLSYVIYVQLECSILRFKFLKETLHKKSMGKFGEMYTNPTPSDKWDYPPPDTIYGYMFDKICEEHQ